MRLRFDEISMHGSEILARRSANFASVVSVYSV
jgi:hypothetical protein